MLRYFSLCVKKERAPSRMMMGGYNGDYDNVAAGVIVCAWSYSVGCELNDGG